MSKEDCRVEVLEIEVAARPGHSEDAIVSQTLDTARKKAW
jgi:hypothetical protein